MAEWVGMQLWQNGLLVFFYAQNHWSSGKLSFQSSHDYRFPLTCSPLQKEAELPKSWFRFYIIVFTQFGVGYTG